MSGTYPASPAPARASVPKSYEPGFVSTAHSLYRQVRSRGGQRWMIDLEYAPMERADFAPLYAFAAKNGIFDTFTYYLHGGLATPLGQASGSPKVNNEVGSPTIVPSGRSIYVRGFNFGTALKAMDFFKFANHAKVYMTTDDLVVGSPDTTLLSFIPDLLESPAHNEVLTVTSVPFTMSFTQETVEALMTPGVFYEGFKVSMIEVPD